MGVRGLTIKEKAERHEMLMRENDLKRWALGIFACNEKPEYSDQFKHEDSTVKISLYRSTFAHGGLVIEVEKNKTWKFPDVRVFYLDDLLMQSREYSNGCAARSEWNTKRFSIINRMQNERHKLLYPEQSA